MQGREELQMLQLQVLHEEGMQMQEMNALWHTSSALLVQWQEVVRENARSMTRSSREKVTETKT